jgi:predicted MFS family arabinose efflux permease
MTNVITTPTFYDSFIIDIRWRFPYIRSYEKQGLNKIKSTMLIKKLIPLYIGAIVGPMGGFGMVPLIPVLAQSWSLEFATAALSITMYMVPFIVFQVFSGSIAQIFDVRKTLLVGFAAYTAGALLTAFSTNFLSFILCRIIQGIGAAFLSPIIMALIGVLVPAKHIGKAMGGLGLAYTIGVTMGPLISGVIEVLYGWQGFFLFLAAISTVAAILFWVWCRNIGGQKSNRHSLFDIFPLIRQAFFHPGLLYLSFGAFTLFLAYIGILTFTADYLKTFVHLPSDQVGFLLSLTGFSGIIISPIAGVLGDRFSRWSVFIGGVAIIISSLALMLIWDFQYWRYSAFFLLLGTGAAAAWTSLNTMAVQSSSTMRESVTSLYSVIKFSGYALSPLILAVFYGGGRLWAIQSACIVVVIISAVLILRVRNH